MGGGDDKGYASMPRFPAFLAQVENLVSSEITSGWACGPGHLKPILEPTACQVLSIATTDLGAGHYHPSLQMGTLVSER